MSSGQSYAQLKAFLKAWKKREPVLGMGQWPLAEPLAVLLLLSQLENKLCDPINFLLKTLKDVDFLSF